MGDETVFAIAIVAGLLMAVYPNFVLFRPSRRGKWICNMISEKAWTVLTRVFGILFAALSAFFLVSGT